MMLWDRVTITSRRTGEDRPMDMTVPAHVYTLSSERQEEEMSIGPIFIRMRAMIGPDLPRTIDPTFDRVEHRGTTYQMDGPPMGRYKRGALHHWTLNLERSTV